jgi:N-acetylmuramoyl-L-alanine amidase
MLAMLALFACVPPSCASIPTRAQAQLLSRNYVRLNDWAKANGLEVRWVKREEAVRISNRSFSAELAVGSRQAQINFVQVWLSFPPVLLNGGICVTRTDLDTVLAPLLVPPRNRPGANVITICLDAGHGGKDPGNCVGSNQEKKYTLLLAQELREQLRKGGFKVTMTRTSDTFIELPDRPAVARRQKADLLVSLHFNSTGTSRDSVQGAQVFCLTPAGAQSTNAGGEGAGAGAFAGNRNNDRNISLAFQMQKGLTKGLGVEDRGVRRARFWVLRDATMPAVLIEAGFMSHPKEGPKIFTSSYRRQMALAIVNGLTAYKRTVEKGG